MKDVTINQLADEVALNYPGITKEQIRYICHSMMASILGTVSRKDARIRLQHADIHTIYYDIVPSEQRALLADLDESRVLTPQEEQLHIIERLANKNLPGKIKRLNRRHKRAHYSRFSADTLYPE